MMYEPRGGGNACHGEKGKNAQDPDFRLAVLKMEFGTTKSQLKAHSGVQRGEPTRRKEAERTNTVSKSFLTGGCGPCGELATAPRDKRGQSLLGFNSRRNNMDEPEEQYLESNTLGLNFLHF